MNVFIPSSGLETHTPTTVGIVDCGKVFFCCKIQHPGRHMDTIRGCRISFVSKTRPPIYPTRHSVGLANAPKVVAYPYLPSLQSGLPHTYLMPCSTDTA